MSEIHALIEAQQEYLIKRKSLKQQCQSSKK